MDRSPVSYIVGRSSSHFTRLVRLFALELGVAYEFAPVYDLSSLDARDYAGNPALKLPSAGTPITYGLACPAR